MKIVLMALTDNAEETARKSAPLGRRARNGHLLLVTQPTDNGGEFAEDVPHGEGRMKARFRRWLPAAVLFGDRVGKGEVGVKAGGGPEAA